MNFRTHVRLSLARQRADQLAAYRERLDAAEAALPDAPAKRKRSRPKPQPTTVPSKPIRVSFDGSRFVAKNDAELRKLFAARELTRVKRFRGACGRTGEVRYS